VPFREDDPESREIPVPERMQATCPKHGFIATVLIGYEHERTGISWVVRCGYCGQPCALEHTHPEDNRS
jgi:hypothetical protein